MISDEKWKKVMDSTDGHKVGRAIYEALRDEWVKDGAFPFANSDWTNLYEVDQNRYINAAGKLFDDGVIESGHALPKLYVEARNSNPEA
jgi:hypothetical protein